ncbi:endolytic transglycosylase MltG [Microbacterium sp. P04]|uniref:endolytic transglycosylase MltG n=1 Tax=Microbacterium sp. P04 TaxID=3366947 RepID=UPI003744D3B8
MPDTPSPFDDPLADLYGQLPDPARNSGDAARSEAVPSSRRAARASRGQTGPSDVQPPITRPAAAPAPQRPATASPPERPSAAPERTAAPERSAPQRPVATRERPAAGASANGATRPAATGTLDDLFTGRRSVDDLATVAPPAERRRRRIGGWIALILVLVLVGGVAAGGIWAWNTFGTQIQGMLSPKEREDFEPGLANGEASISIVGGDAGPQVSQKLYDAGVLKAPTSLYDYMIETSTSFVFQPGVYTLQKQMTAADALAAIGNPANKMEFTAQLREGLTVEDSVELLSAQLAMPIEDFQAAVSDPAAYGVAADSLEGWLFPATYTFDPGVTAKDVITRMVARTVESLDTAGVAEGDRERVLTIASIIQREARFEADFYKVSRVIANRLDPGNQETFGLLQMDSTAQYGYGENHDGTASSSQEALDDDNPWNTYRHPGLPIGPISNPGDLAIDAALHPADGDWLYFVTVNLDTGETVFTNNSADHQAAVDQWISWCQGHPDSGC